MEVDGIELLPSGMAHIKEHKTGVVADLHIGMEEIGLVTARVQTAEMLKVLLDEISSKNLERVVIAGDIKHGFNKRTSQEWEEIRIFFDKLLNKVEVVALKGNHDFYIQNILRERAEVKDTFRVGRYIITHGHHEVLRGKEDILIMGNEHPSVMLKDDVGASVKARAFVWFEKEKILILPAFNPLTTGSDVRNLEHSHLSKVLRGVEIDKGKVFVIEDEGGEVLDFGTIRDIKQVF